MGREKEAIKEIISYLEFQLEQQQEQIQEFVELLESLETKKSLCEQWSDLILFYFTRSYLKK